MFSCNLRFFFGGGGGGEICFCGNTGVERIPKESAQKVDPGEENSPAAPAGTRTRDLSIRNPVFYH